MTAPEPIGALVARLREMNNAATSAPWCIDSVGEKQNEYIVGVAFAASDESCSHPLSGWLPPLAEDEAEWPYCDEKVCELEGAANAALIVEMRNSLPRLLDSLERMSRLLFDARPWMEEAMANPVDGGSFEECKAWLKKYDELTPTPKGVSP